MTAILAFVLAILFPAWLSPQPLQHVAARPDEGALWTAGPQQSQTPSQPAQGPARDTKAAAKTGSGEIRGRVTDADTGEPLRRARVSLTCPDQSVSRAVRSDLEGRFVFDQLPACRWSMSVSKPSYLALAYGQTRPSESSRLIELADGQTVEKLDMALPRGGVITGRVTDDLGDPVAQVRVAAMRRAYSYTEGHRRLVPVGNGGETDDLGRFRLSGLAAGTYVVGTSFTPVFWARPENGPAFVPTYYPGTPHVAEAQAVTVQTGRERAGTDFALAVGRTVSVSGTVVDSSGRPHPTATVSITYSEGSGSIRLGVPVEAGGQFRATNVVPGEYMLSAQVGEWYTGEGESVTLPISVAGEDITGLTLVLGAGARLIGHIDFAEGVSPDFAAAALRVGTVAERDVTRSSSVREDWSFELRNVDAGRNRFYASGLPAGWWIAAAAVGDRAVPDGLFEVRPGETLAGVRIVLSNRPRAVLSGNAIDERGRPIVRYKVVVFSQDRSRWTAGGPAGGPSFAPVSVTSTPDLRGEFKVNDLRPGRYFAVAVEYLDQGDEFDPEFLDRWSRRATRVEMTEGSQVTVTLKIVKAEG